MKGSPPEPELLSLNTATVREKWSLRQMIEGCARHRIRGISPWRDKLAEMGVKEAAKAIRDNGLTVTGLCRGGMFPAADRKARRAAIDDNLRAIDDAATLEAKCLVLVAGGLPPGSKDLAGARGMVRDGVGEMLDHASSAGVPLAIEPLHPMYCADRGPPHRPRHDGRRRNRPPAVALLDGTGGVPRLSRGRDPVLAQLVAAGPGRSARDLPYAAPDCLLMLEGHA